MAEITGSGLVLILVTLALGVALVVGRLNGFVGEVVGGVVSLDSSVVDEVADTGTVEELVLHELVHTQRSEMKLTVPSC